MIKCRVGSWSKYARYERAREKKRSSQREPETFFVVRSSFRAHGPLKVLVHRQALVLFDPHCIVHMLPDEPSFFCVLNIFCICVFHVGATPPSVVALFKSQPF